MSEIERIISNVNATMEMENMPLTDETKSMLKSCLEGKVTICLTALLKSIAGKR